jgi:hypothetical protein
MRTRFILLCAFATSREIKSTAQEGSAQTQRRKEAKGIQCVLMTIEAPDKPADFAVSLIAPPRPGFARTTTRHSPL